MADEPPDYRHSLANERTYLAYVRTALALLIAGTALLHLEVLGSESETFIFGCVLMVFGIVLSFGGYFRYRANERAIQAGRRLNDTSLPLLFVVIIGGLGMVAIILALVN
ncbi:MAG: DUF202 domain-containing protein [Actinomycetia bacterium]|nr:DUF202 domain-containing protein [Actinomycetes bacterium]